MSTKLNFGQTYMKFALTMATPKMMDTQLTYNGIHPTPASPLVGQRVKLKLQNYNLPYPRIT